MPDDGFGSSLWKNVQAVKLGEDGGIQAPVRANSRQGIVVGVDATKASDGRQPADPGDGRQKSPGLWRRVFRR
ncbi:hypothetical protein ABEG17_03995 [Pedococcus sp. KACC 23699]|uniref:Uncharacterized protein n=1 Tax=Pedococcus sp. KACC 23699 TaxID=3149228 RepID=A0AAU7JWH0_9MICO